jgi:hypothetical protein
MKVLFVSSGFDQDYQCDMLFHGLKSLNDIEVYETSDLWYMFDDMNSEKKGKLYGRGFSIYGLLDNKSRNYEDKRVIEEKINSRWYDFIIYAQIKRDDSYIDLVKKIYSKNEIAIVDGQDHQYLLRKYFGIGMYFKRELTDKDAKKGALPISFAIPGSKITETVPAKSKDWGSIIPGKKSTYIFFNEADYYKDYQESKYGLTMKKAGWDCLRHYEILANGCIPYFEKIEKCPGFTLTSLPKDFIYRSNLLIKSNKMTEKLVSEYIHFYLEWTKKYLTTTALAKYVLGHYQS